MDDSGWFDEARFGVFVLLAAAVHLDNPNDVTSLVLAGMLQVITMPVGANLMNRAVYRTQILRDDAQRTS